MRVKFLLDARATTENGPEVLLQAGQEADLPEASADRWIRRGVAKIAAERPSKKKRAKKKK